MQRYMKSEMPYRGVQKAGQDAVYKELFPAHVLGSFEAWRDTVLLLWREAEFREERYAAIALSGYRAYKQFQTMASLPLYEELILSGAWWDYVDAVAVHRIGPLVLRFSTEMRPHLLDWSRDAFYMEATCGNHLPEPF